MNRISKYQDGILKFIKTKSLINDSMTDITNKILLELLDNEDHIPAILCLTILNNQCKKNDIKIHGYYLASGIDMMMIVAKICSNTQYYYEKYGQTEIDNLIVQVNNFFYKCVMQNIDTLRLSKNGNINSKLIILCIDYASKLIPLITKKTNYKSNDKMKKTDLFNMPTIKQTYYQEYKKKNMLEKNIIIDDMIQRYGSVCKLALCLSWILGQEDEVKYNKLKSLNDDKMIIHLEKLSEYIGKFLKLYDDFQYIERDICIGKYSLNYVVNHGLKEGYIELIESKANLVELSMILDVETKTSKEIVEMIVKRVDEIVKDVSVDLGTDYQDVSTI